MLVCKDLVVNTEKTQVFTQLKFKYHQYSDYKDFNNKVVMSGTVKPSCR